VCVCLRREGGKEERYGRSEGEKGIGREGSDSIQMLQHLNHHPLLDSNNVAMGRGVGRWVSGKGEK
jgi:hypothetical protein